jgi:PKD repeat protein
LAVGDFLLAGHDQLILAGYQQSGGGIQLDLIDYNHPFFFVLPTVGEAGTRSAHFQTGLNIGFNTPFFAIDDAPPIAMQGSSPGGGVLDDMRVDAGDVVDTAADELVVHVMFPEPTSPVSRVLAQRLLHFITTRDVNNNITAIALGDPSIVTHAFDSSIMLERYNGFVGYATVGPRIAAAVADIDGAGKREIVTARAGHDGSSGPYDGPLVWFAHKVRVRPVPSYQYQNKGTISGQPIVKFTNNSRGDIKSYSWNFGDGTFGPDKNPQHAFPINNTYTVKLTVTMVDDTQVVYSSFVTANSGTDANPIGAAPPAYTYKIDPVPAFKGNGNPGFVYLTLPASGDQTVLKLAVGDTNRDGLPEIVVAVSNGLAAAVDTHVFTRQVDPPGDTDGSQNFVRTSSTQSLNGNLNMELLLSDFDGDAISAELSGSAGDCRLVTDLTVRSLTWMPPYFSTLQATSYRYAEIGKSKNVNTGQETTSESHFTESITGYVGVEGKAKIPIVDIQLGETSIKFSAGGSWQQTSGESHGDESGFTADEAYDIGTDTNTAQAEGIVLAETDSSNCYTYTMVNSNGVVPGSGARICTLKNPPLKSPRPSAALDWNSLVTEVGPHGEPIQVPLHWVPAQRDWASLALFHAPTAGAATGSLVFSDPVSHGVSQLTDGNFDTAAESDTADRPYIDIDLGVQRDILSVRVFPSANPPSKVDAFEPLDFKQAVPDLADFRLYASLGPFIGNNPPSAATVTTFNPEYISTFVQDTAIYRIWNVYTGDPFSGQPLHTRYLRLQKPTNGKIRISEIQVFGDTHTEPHFYPEGVCDDKIGDGRFWARVFDTVNHLDKTIQVRGDLVWTGAVDEGSTDTGVINPKDGTPCVNDTSDGSSDPASPKVVAQHPFWTNNPIGFGNVAAKWNLQEDTSHTDTQIHSNDASVHAGVELDTQGPSDVHVIAGAEFEFEYGLNTEFQNQTTMGTGFAVGAELAGFAVQDYHTGLCHYYPRPYAFQVREYSDPGYLQDVYVTDYIVRQGNGDSWVRDAFPSDCWTPDPIFSYGF